MITAGLKFTQSGGLALLDDDRLVFNIEMQKLDNNSRYSNFDDLALVPKLLADYGYSVNDVDHWVVDGWDGARNGHVKVQTPIGAVDLTVAPYRETPAVPDPGRPAYRGELHIDGVTRPYTSFVHVAGHLSVAYATSPFAARAQPAIVMVWDGGCFPRLYSVNAQGRIEPGGEAFPLIGHTYSMASQHWGPYKRTNKSQNVDDLSVAGKLMAYIALGRPDDAVKAAFAERFHEHFEAPTERVRRYRETIIGCGSNGERSHGYVHAFLADVAADVERLGVSDEDVLATVHEFLEELLLERVTAKIRAWKGDEPVNFCFAGGCALNIKWNSALRGHPMIKAMWVPPFPDDSGSAIGTACAHLGVYGGLRPIEWHARLGPRLLPTPQLPEGWTATPCTPQELGRLLHETGEPVVVLNGRAELGPRALGGRSILAAPVSAGMKDRLNEIKRREHYRPVAPICLEEHAPAIFDPGTPDPYMLFEHVVRPEWVPRIPAVLHLDGTARLQTVSPAQDPDLTEILRAYHAASGIPVLCNTSANFNGSGFFPDAGTAIGWDKVDLVWDSGTLLRRTA
ncbi:carbamoyltransferase N-terminal domain-containing protein [Dactylosporangium matsuzakiense]|uniref:Nodulation protein U n=1 Tax=Dactylosporangium matsuzakiense TaxID=53360 RepID=A0A9W6NTS3_9ACTN|nr:nodulation protein U [Dactylosporangium matsuzakiense]